MSAELIDDDVLFAVPQPGATAPPPRHGHLVAERTWLRWGAKPYLIVADCLAYGVMTLITRPPHPSHLLVLAVSIVCFALFGLYRARLSRSLLDDVSYIAAGVLIATALKIAMFGTLSGVDPPARQAVHGAVFLLVLILIRAFAYGTIRHARCSGRLRYGTLIVGAGHVGIQLARTLQRHREYGIDPVGFLDSHPRIEDGAKLPAPLLGKYEELADIIEDFNVRNVMVAFGTVRESDLIELLRTCDRLDCEIFFIPRLFEIHYTSRRMDRVWGIPLVRVTRAPFRTVSWKLKRLVDIVLSAVALLLLSPIMAACAIAVRLEGGPGILFRQTRVGLDGRPFDVLKFRSLKPSTKEEASTTWNIKHDDRLQPVGRFLRATSLDELPQLWNILTGNMSLVGPRPERPHFVQQFAAHIPRYMARHRVPAGLTGWAQVHGLRGDTSIEERARFDNYYIENWSLWGDFKIMLRTFEQVLLRRGG